MDPRFLGGDNGGFSEFLRQCVCHPGLDPGSKILPPIKGGLRGVSHSICQVDFNAENTEFFL